MKIIAAIHLGRNGRQYKPGESFDVSPKDAQLYVLSRQARYPTENTAKKPSPAAPVEKKPIRPPSPQRDTKPEPEADATSEGTDKPRKGRHRRRDMRAEGDE